MPERILIYMPLYVLNANKDETQGKINDLLSLNILVKC